MNPIKRPVRNSGFTLLEILIALSILAISAMAVINQTAPSLKQLDLLQQRTVATVMAENYMNSLRANDSWPVIGRQSQQVNFANQQWIISTEVSATSEPWLRKIAIAISNEEGNESVPLADLVGYRGQY